MNLDRALEVVRFQRRQLGRKLTHCSEPLCTTCALLTIADELDWQWSKKRRASAEPAKRPATSRKNCASCGGRLIDGICANCNG